MSVTAQFATHIEVEKTPGLLERCRSRVERFVSRLDTVEGLDVVGSDERLALTALALDALEISGTRVDVAVDEDLSVLWAESAEETLVLAIDESGAVTAEVAGTQGPACSRRVAAVTEAWAAAGVTVEIISELRHDDPGGARLVPPVRHELLAPAGRGPAEIVLGGLRAGGRPVWTESGQGSGSSTANRETT